MRQHLDTKFDKPNPNHIKDVMIECELPPTPDAPIGLYYAKQNKCISLLVDTDEPHHQSETTTNPLRPPTGHPINVASSQQLQQTSPTRRTQTVE